MWPGKGPFHPPPHAEKNGLMALLRGDRQPVKGARDVEHAEKKDAQQEAEVHRRAEAPGSANARLAR